jgi:ATP-binding cassette subfamily B protein
MEEKKQRQVVSTKRVLQFIWQEYKKFPKYGLICLGIRIITIILGILPALYYKDIIDFLSTNLATSETASHAIGILMIIFWMKLTSAILMRVMDYFFINFETRMNEDLYIMIWQYMQKHSFQFFSDNFTGSLISKVRKCVGAVERFTDNLNFGGIDFVLQVILILIIVGTQNLWISLAFFIVIVGCIFSQYKLFRRIAPYQQKANQLDSDLGGLLSDDITNTFNIKIFSSFFREGKDFANLTNKAMKARRIYYYKSMRIRGIARGLTGLLLEIGTIYIALFLRGQGILSIGIIVLLQTYVLTLIDHL